MTVATIFGRERYLVDKVADKVLSTLRKLGDYSPRRETGRGSYFDLAVEVDGKRTGHVVRVTVELDRFDPELVQE